MRVHLGLGQSFPVFCSSFFFFFVKKESGTLYFLGEGKIDFPPGDSLPLEANLDVLNGG